MTRDNGLLYRLLGAWLLIHICAATGLARLAPGNEHNGVGPVEVAVITPHPAPVTSAPTPQPPPPPVSHPRHRTAGTPAPGPQPRADSNLGGRERGTTLTPAPPSVEEPTPTGEPSRLPWANMALPSGDVTSRELPAAPGGHGPGPRTPLPRGLPTGTPGNDIPHVAGLSTGGEIALLSSPTGSPLDRASEVAGGSGGGIGIGRGPGGGGKLMPGAIGIPYGDPGGIIGGVGGGGGGDAAAGPGGPGRALVVGRGNGPGTGGGIPGRGGEGYGGGGLGLGLGSGPGTGGGRGPGAGTPGPAVGGGGTGLGGTGGGPGTGTKARPDTRRAKADPLAIRGFYPDGITADFYDDDDLATDPAPGTPITWPTFTRHLFTQKQQHIRWLNHDRDLGPESQPIAAQYYSIRWTGKLMVPADGDYQFVLDRVDDGARLYIDGQKLVESWMVQRRNVESQVVKLTKGLHDIVVEYCQGPCCQDSIMLSWQSNLFPKELIGPAHK
jgi:hypothetical protein